MIFVPVADFTAVCTSLSGSIACVAPRASFGLGIGSPVFVVVSAADIRRARPSAVPRRVRAKTMLLSSRRAVVVGGQTRRERRAAARARVGCAVAYDVAVSRGFRVASWTGRRADADRPTDRALRKQSARRRDVPECAIDTDVASIDGS